MSTKASIAYDDKIGIHVYVEMMDEKIHIDQSCSCCDVAGHISLTEKQFEVVAKVSVNWLKMIKERRERDKTRQKEALENMRNLIGEKKKEKGG